jgi:pilus assembly protein CpaB
MVMRHRLLSILVAVVLAGTAAGLVALYVTSYRDRVDAGGDTVDVWVADRDIPEGTSAAQVASGKFLRQEAALRRSVVPGAISAPTQLGDVVAAQTIFAGSQVSERQFRPAAQQGVLAQLTGTMRAFALPGTPLQLLAGMLRTGNHVDVVANIEYKVTPRRSDGKLAQASEDRNRVAARVILRDLLVLRAPQKVEAATAEGGGPLYSVSLAVSDSQVQKLFFAMENGDWSLALRPGDHPQDSPDSVETIESVLADGLQARQLHQLTGGYEKESINGK